MARTDGRTLYLASCSIGRTVTLHCTRQGCSGKWTWYPVTRPGTGNGTRGG
jgi:hypothetical protein